MPPSETRTFVGLDDEYLESFCKAEGRANELRLDSTLRASNNYAYGVLLRQPVCAVPQGARDYPEPRASCCPSPHSQQRREGSTALLALLCGFSPTLLLPRRPIRRSYALHRPASFAPRCAATSLLLRSCTVVLTIKRWDAPRPVSLTRGFKGHTPFIRPVLATACDCISLCTKTTLNLCRAGR